MLKKIFFWVLLFIFAYLILEGAAFAGLYFLNRVSRVHYAPISATRLSEIHRQAIEDVVAGKPRYLAHSPVLGWTVKPNGAAQRLSVSYQANSKGIRSSREVELVSQSAKLRIAAFGDSFTHGDEVNNDETWEEKLNGLDAGLDVLNFGVLGYGLDQAYLRYKEEGALFHPRVVIIGFMSEDIRRSVSVFRPFYTPSMVISLAKPRFILVNNKLVLLKNPLSSLEDFKSLLENEKLVLSKLGEHDFYFQTTYHKSFFDFSPLLRLFKILRQEFFNRFDPKSIYFNGRYNERSEAFRVTTKIFDAFYEEALKNGAQPVIVIFPNRQDFYQYQKEKVPDYGPLLNYLSAKNYRTLDMLDGFERFGQGHSADDYFNGGNGHYSPLGNEIVAKALYQFLKKKSLI